MKNRIDQLFEIKEKNILSVYVTAGFPRLDDTATILRALGQSGADMIEIGIPFSDPLADGPTIQQSNQIALNNGMHLNLLFTQLKDIRKSLTLPLILMGYFNPILQFGVEKFCAACASAGIDGVIIPDLPAEEFEQRYKLFFEQYRLHAIFLVTPQSSDERIRLMDRVSGGMVYAVSSFGITGETLEQNEFLETYLLRLQKLCRHPVLVGFGISDARAFRKICSLARGAILGSSFIRAIQNSRDLEKDIQKFIAAIQNDMD